MRIIARKNIVAYFATHPLTRASLTHWLEVAENADWSSTIEVMADRSEEHTYELQSLMRISYAVFCLKKEKETSLYINTSLLMTFLRSIRNVQTQHIRR